jgi:hypothetical protein
LLILIFGLDLGFGLEVLRPGHIGDIGLSLRPKIEAQINNQQSEISN